MAYSPYTEETASPGLWKSALVATMGLALFAVAFAFQPGNSVTYANWLIGVIATNTAIAMTGNQNNWERLLAGAAAVWLFMSGFVPSLVSGPWMRTHEIAIGAILIVAAIAAHLHLRDDIRHHRPVTM